MSLLDIYRQSIDPIFVNPQYVNTSNFMSQIGSRDAMATNFFDPNFGIARERAGIQDLTALRASETYGLRALEARNEQAEAYRTASEEYNLQLAEQARAQATFGTRLEDMNRRLAGVKEGMNTSASKASSVRQFSQMSQQVMQGTNRYLAELERFRSPDAVDIDFSFRNPITGEEMDLNTRFEDVYEEGVDPRDLARQTVMDDFNTRTAQIKEQFLAESAEEFGTVADFIQGYDSMADFEENYMRDQWTPGRGASWNPETDQAYQAQLAYMRQYENVKQIEGNAQDFAEAKALAQMAGIEDPIRFGSRSQLEADASTMFYQQDINQILEGIVDTTTERFEINRLGEREDFRQEFESRRERAIQQRDLFDNQMRSNQQQAEMIAQEKNRVRQLMEDQRREYAQALSSFGASPSKDGPGIQFTDNRPM